MWSLFILELESLLEKSNNCCKTSSPFHTYTTTYRFEYARQKYGMFLYKFPFSQIFQILDLPFDLILPGIVRFPEICHSSAINFDFLKTVEFFYFQSLTFALPMILFYHYRNFIEDWVGALVLYAATVSEMKQTNFTTAKL